MAVVQAVASDSRFTGAIEADAPSPLKLLGLVNIR
jgi:hypothetical protein